MHDQADGSYSVVLRWIHDGLLNRKNVHFRVVGDGMEIERKESDRRRTFLTPLMVSYNQNFFPLRHEVFSRSWMKSPFYIVRSISERALMEFRVVKMLKLNGKFQFRFTSRRSQAMSNGTAL